MAVLLANNVSTTLATAIDTTDTAVIVSAGTGDDFPAVSPGDHFYATLVTTTGLVEIVRCTARTGDSLTVARAEDNTVATAFPVGSLVEMRVNVAALTDYLSQFSAEDRYQGLQASDPSVRLSGSPLESGDFYFNSTTNTIRVYNGVSWEGTSSTKTVEEQTASAAQTIFSLANPYTPGGDDLSVYINGVRQDSTAYTETNTTTVTFVSGLTSGDGVVFVVQ
jgi:hypothetical protein